MPHFEVTASEPCGRWADSTRGFGGGGRSRIFGERVRGETVRAILLLSKSSASLRISILPSLPWAAQSSLLVGRLAEQKGNLSKTNSRFVAVCGTFNLDICPLPLTPTRHFHPKLEQVTKYREQADARDLLLAQRSKVAALSLSHDCPARQEDPLVYTLGESLHCAQPALDELCAERLKLESAEILYHTMFPRCLPQKGNFIS